MLLVPVAAPGEGVVGCAPNIPGHPAPGDTGLDLREDPILHPVGWQTVLLTPTAAQRKHTSSLK